MTIQSIKVSNYFRGKQQVAEEKGAVTLIRLAVILPLGISLRLPVTPKGVLPT